MIPYANHLLNQWGIWCITGSEKLGYPRQAAFLNGQPQAHRGAPLAICDDQALQIQRAVNSLDNELKKLVMLFYVRMRSCDKSTIARALHVCDKTLYNRLHRAHVLVIDSIHDDELVGR